MTQVTSPQDDYVYHDRLTHSLKVAQVGQRLAQRLRVRQPQLGSAVNADRVYAAALAHDIGHPPFGHAAETEFQRILAGDVSRDGGPGNGLTILEDSFEGNAQSFRIVTRLSFRKVHTSAYEPDGVPLGESSEATSPEDQLSEQIRLSGGGGDFAGLNLTWDTLYAIQKYPWKYGEGPLNEKLAKKWGFYYSERDYFDALSEQFPSMTTPSHSRSVNAEIMDWADDIAYAIHDSEDFYKAGLIPLERLHYDINEWHRFTEWAAAKSYASLVGYLSDADEIRRVQADFESELEGTLEIIRQSLPRIHFDGSRHAHRQLHHFTTRHIEGLSRQADLNSDGQLVITTAGRMRAEILKSLTGFYVHRTPALYAAQLGQRRVIRELFFDLWDIVRTDRSFGGASQRAVAGRLPLTVLPPRLWEFCEHAVTDGSMVTAGTRDGRLARAVVDFICSLTDRQATLLNERLTGNSVGQLSPYWLTV